MMILFMFQGATDVYSQNSEVTYLGRQDTSGEVVKTGVTIRRQQIGLVSVLRMIEEQTDFSIIYRDIDIDNSVLVDMNVQAAEVSDVLNQLFDGQVNEFTIFGRIIVITSNRQSSARSSSRHEVQQIHRITGRVTDSATGESLIGATITIRGTTLGTSTNVDGEFSLDIPSPESVIVVSYVGYVTQEINVDGRTELTIALVEELFWLDGVVVVGYGTQRVGDISSSVTTVNVDRVGERPITDVAQAIQGKAAGVQVIQPSGKPGTALSVRIRGSTSVQAGNEPLYVVDGVPMTNIQSLNPRDVESLQILKDASSAAIYGSRAANGVVLITTKRGISGMPRVRFSSTVGFSDLKLGIDALNTEQYREMMSEIYGPGTVPDSYSHYTNWMDKTFGTGVYQDYQISASGGTDLLRYYLSVAYLNQDGIVNPASTDRFNFRINLDNQVLNWLKVSTNLSYTKRDRRDAEDNMGVARGGIILSAINTPPFLDVWNPDPNFSGQFMANPYQPSWENPLAYMSRAGWDRGNRLTGNLISDISLLENLTFRTNFGIDYDNWNWYQFIDPIQTSYGRQENGRATDNQNSNFNWLLENTANYRVDVGEHSFGALAGMTLQHNLWDLKYITVRDFPDNTSVKTLNVANQIENAGTVQSEWSLMSYLGRFTYNYQSKYLLTSTMRYDGSSKLAEGNRWGMFPSVSVAWRISGEPFMQNATMITDLKLRAGLGKTGNQEGISDYAAYGLFSTNRIPPTQPLSGPAMQRVTFENEDLRWETTTQTNIGVDLLLFDGRLGFTADAYYKKTTDLLLNVLVPQIGAANYITRNDGEMENRGLEFSISTVNLDSRVKWNSDFNISFNRNEVTKLGLNQVYDFAEIYSNTQTVIRIEPGMSLGTFFGYIADGVDPETGMMMYRDVDGSGTLTAADRTVIGNAQPDFVFGFTNEVRYAGFEFLVFLQGSYGNDIYNASRIDSEGMFDHKNQSTNVLKRWRTPGDITSIPRATSDMSNVRNSSRFVEDGSYLRVKTVTLSYALNRRFINRFGMNNMNVFATAQNLFTLTNYSGFDPEVNAYGTSNVALGVDYGTYPQSRTIIFGVNIEF